MSASSQFISDLEKYFPHQATEQQKKLFKKLNDFIYQPNKSNCFIVKGYAGTGKTSCISSFIKVLLSYHKSFVILAPTGRAAKVISAYAKEKASTIHRKIYRKTNANSLELSFSLAQNKHHNTIFIVDEASMLNNDETEWGRGLLNDLFKYVYNGKNNRIIFIGDTAQLPPIGVNYSPALSEEYIESNYSISAYSAELTDVVRQKDSSGILQNATQIRNLMLQEAFEYPILTTKKYKDVYKINGDKIIEAMHYAYKKYQVQNTLVICRSNKSANLYNQHIRQQVLSHEDELVAGDLLMVVKNNYFWMPEDKGGFIANGEMAKIIRVRKITEMYGLRFADVTLELDDNDDSFTIDCKIILDAIYAESSALSFDKQKEFYQQIMLDYAHVKSKKEKQELLRTNPYYQALQVKFGYAVTCHKAQGGQWEMVFVDQGYLKDDGLNLDLLRWLYTATTRATKELFYVNFKDQFFY